MEEPTHAEGRGDDDIGLMGFAFYAFVIGIGAITFFTVKQYQTLCDRDAQARHRLIASSTQQPSRPAARPRDTAGLPAGLAVKIGRDIEALLSQFAADRRARGKVAP